MQITSALVGFLTILLRKKWIILLVFLLLGGLSSSYIWVQPPVYVATASLLAKFGREFVYRFETSTSGTVAPSYSPDEIINSLIGILKTEEIADAVVRQIGHERLYPDMIENPASTIPPHKAAVRRFMGDLKIRPTRNTNILTIEFSSQNPEMAADALNAFLEAFRTKYLELYGEKNFEFLVAHLGRLKLKLDGAESALDAFEQSKRAYALDTQVDLLLRQRHDLDLQDKLAEAEAAGVIQKIAALQSRIGESAPSIKISIEADLQQIQERRRIIKGQVSEIDQKIEDITANQRALRDLRRERDTTQLSYAAYLQKVEEARVLRSMDTNRITSVEVVEHATPPLNPAAPSRKIKIALVLLFSMIVAVGSGCLSHLLSRRFYTKADLERAFDIPVLAEIAFVKA
jgi:uncharacterized protein involved in exopolysaccharide biosynthesis